MLFRLVLLLLITTTYSIIRYTVWGTVSVAHIPVYLLNKSIGLAAVLCLLFLVLSIRKQASDRVNFWANSAYHLVAIHVVMSALILSRDYYPKLFDTLKMNLTGELTLLFGVLAGYAIWHARHHKFTRIHPKIFQSIASVFILGHLIVLGFSGWFKVGDWNGGLPPISLLSFVIVFSSLLFSIKRKKNVVHISNNKV